MIKYYDGVTITPKQLASRIVAAHGAYEVEDWVSGMWHEITIFMTEREIEETERFVKIQSQRVLKFLNIKALS